jgi:hypothetical protein
MFSTEPPAERHWRFTRLDAVLWNATGSLDVAAYDVLKPDFGRVIGITLLKNW